MEKKGSFVAVGVGMTLGAHICPLSRSYIEHADIVFCSLSDSYVEEWVMTMNSEVRSLQSFYAVGKDRRDTYKEMVAAMMTEVRAGKNVVGAFYGHPGVFALAPHKVIAIARDEGFQAHMEPGISAEDCLYADMGLDPGTNGCIHYEANQFLMNKKCLDTSALLILWQVGMVGDRRHQEFESHKKYRHLLMQSLMAFYPADHRVALYEAAVLPIDEVRIEWLTLKNIGDAKIHQHTTMVIPPGFEKQTDTAFVTKLNELDSL